MASAIVFGPAPGLPDKSELARLCTLTQKVGHLTRLAVVLTELEDFCDIISRDSNNVITFNDRVKGFAKGFRLWMESEETDTIANQGSTIVSLPLLTFAEICIYFQYLEISGWTHAELLNSISVAGVQGYCGGMLATLAIASAQNEEEIVSSASNCIRAAFIAGVYMSREEDGPQADRRTTLIARLKHPGQHEELVKMFPDVYTAAITDPRSICFAGTETGIASLTKYASANGLSAQHTYPTGSILGTQILVPVHILLLWCISKLNIFFRYHHRLPYFTVSHFTLVYNCATRASASLQ